MPTTFEEFEERSLCELNPLKLEFKPASTEVQIRTISASVLTAPLCENTQDVILDLKSAAAGAIYNPVLDVNLHLIIRQTQNFLLK